MYMRFDALLVRALRRVSPLLLRATMGLIFIWFGLLKFTDDGPVGDLVANTVPWFDRHWFVPALGAVEVALGLALLLGRLLGAVVVILVGHMTGTFLVFVMQPEVAFQHGNPFMLTTEGEFVAKNIVLIAAALVVAARFHASERDHAVPPPI